MKSVTVLKLSYKSMVVGAFVTMISLILSVLLMNLYLLIIAFIALAITAISLIMFLISGYQHTKSMDDRDRD